MTNIKLKGIYALLVTLMTTTQCYELLAQQETTLPQNFGINQLQTSENLSQGVLNINLPIESHLVPVSISYTTSGIRVDQRPGIVGLGWQLQAGGFIARQKRGNSDGNDQNTQGSNDNGGYSGKYRRGQWMANLPDQKHFDQFTGLDQNEDGGRWDSEPDIYVFQFLGQSGRFTIGSDANRTVIKLSANNLKITPYYNTSVNDYSSFTIQDEQGNKYLFSLNEFTKLKLNSTELENYRSKWHLTRITNYATGNEIKFSYTSAPTHTETSYFRWRRYLRTSPYTYFDSSPSGDSYTTEYNAKLLSEISYNDTKIKFNYGNRSDISTLKKLDNINYTLNGNVNINYSFQYKYLGTGSAERLMLAGVQKSSLNVILYQFLYYGETEGEALLPAYNDSKQDHWGFHNNNTQSTKYTHLNANRNPSLNYAKANSLKKTYYTAGGFDEYVYELNSYNKSGTDYNAGGLRIAEVYSDNGQGARYKTKSYDYSVPGFSTSSGAIYAEPDYVQWYDHGNIKLYRYSEYSWKPLTDDLGRHIAYRYVTVSGADDGSVRNKFYTFVDDQILFGTGQYNASVIKGYHNDPGDDDNDAYQGAPQYTTSSFPGPFGNKNFKGTGVGLPEEVIIYDHNGNILSKDVYAYEKRVPSSTILGMDYLMTAHWNHSLQDYFYTDYRLSFYELGYGYLLQNKVTSTAYDATNSGKYLTTVTDIFYDPNHPLEERRETYRSGETTGKRIAKNEYLFQENPPSSGATEAINNNMLSLVKRKTSLIDTDTQGYTASTFGTNSTTLKLELKDQKTYVASYNPLVPVNDLTYNYDSQGRLVGSTDEMTDFENCTILDDDGLRALAEVSNSGLDQSAFTSFEGDDAGGWSLPVLVSSSECSGLQSECMQDCLDNNPVTACFNQCTTDYNACVATVNMTGGVAGSSGYELTDGNITKSLTSGDYILGYWKRSGTVTISGPSTNTILQTRSLSGWTFEERKINMSSTGTLTISGTADIDHLRVHPADAQMSTYTYHSVFGKTSETDSNNNTIYYEYDNAGRLTVVKDRNKDIIKQNTFHIAEYMDLSATTYSPGYTGGTKTIYVTSNDQSWSVSDNASWVSVSPTSGSNNGSFVITVSQNAVSSARSATVTMTNTVAGKTITINQAAAPAYYLTASPTSLNYQFSYQTLPVTINSNVNWTASVQLGPGVTLSPTTGSNNGTLNITIPTYTGGSTMGVVQVVDQGGNTPPQVIFIWY